MALGSDLRVQIRNIAPPDFESSFKQCPLHLVPSTDVSRSEGMP